MLDFAGPTTLKISGVTDIFFFQAEDGIRDLYVTGVQTCALPIWTDASRPAAQAIRIGLVQPALTLTCSTSPGRESPSRPWPLPIRPGEFHLLRFRRRSVSSLARSEERRVGKECRFRVSPVE